MGRDLEGTHLGPGCSVRTQRRWAPWPGTPPCLVSVRTRGLGPHRAEPAGPVSYSLPNSVPLQRQSEPKPLRLTVYPGRLWGSSPGCLA